MSKSLYVKTCKSTSRQAHNVGCVFNPLGYLQSTVLPLIFEKLTVILGDVMMGSNSLVISSGDEHCINPVHITKSSGGAMVLARRM